MQKEDILQSIYNNIFNGSITNISKENLDCKLIYLIFIMFCYVKLTAIHVILL